MKANDHETGPELTEWGGKLLQGGTGPRVAKAIRVLTLHLLNLDHQRYSIFFHCLPSIDFQA